MKAQMKRIAKNLYKRQYQIANGGWSTNYYGAFKDWTGKRRTFPLGDDLKTAKDELAVLKARIFAARTSTRIRKSRKFRT